MEDAMTATRGIRRKVIHPALVLGAAALTIAAALSAEPPSVKKDAPGATDRYGDALPPGAVARLGTVRFRHEGEAWRLAFSPNGKALACNTQVVWDSATGKELYRLPESGLAISADWTTSAHADLPTNAKIVLREMRTGKLIRELAMPNMESGPRNRLDFAPDGKSIVVIGDWQACVIEAETGKVRASIKTKRTEIAGYAFSPNGKVLALGTIAKGADNPSLQLWDIATGAMIQGIENPKEHSPFGIAFSSDGKTVAAGGFDYIILSDVTSGKEIGRLEAEHLDAIAGLAFTPDGKTLVSAGQDCKVRIWEVATNKLRFTLDGRVSTGRALALSPDGETVALGTAGSTVRLWEVRTGKELFTGFVGHDSPVHGLAFSPDGRTLASGGEYQQLRLWDTASWKHDRLFKGSAQILSFSPDGKRLISVPPYNKTVHIWEVATGKDALAITAPETDRVESARLSADGLKLFTVDWKSNPKTNNPGPYRLRHWDATTGKQLDLWTLPPQMVSLLPFPDGTKVVAKDDDVISIHDAQSGRDRPLQGHNEGEAEGWVRPVALSPDGRVLAGGMWGGTFSVRLWEVLTGKEIFHLKGHGCSVFAIAWSPDGRVVASGDRRYYHGEEKAVSTVRLWDTVTGKELARFTGYNSDVMSLAFSPDGAYVAAGLLDSTILVWDVAKIGPRLTLQKLSKEVLETCWGDLAGDDAAKAHKACWALPAAAEQAVPLLRDRLKPVAVVDAGKVQKWIAELDSDEFAMRDAATKELKRLGGQAQTPIAKALKGELNPEARRRLEHIAETLGDEIEPGTVRTVRAVMVLEKVGSPEAREVLDKLAHGAVEARETAEAKAALARLAKRPSQMP
jgi:WD40 repeat protein